ncbi:MAG: FadR family transcriptional regulator [Prosthecobacter sp.]|jgi:DNA-binding FadR family transcriptional regulator|uniref:FadR/GntR family transcriptional regulator n=1 Tax=Prosthecobacter sp. TaxID=1965333 RepID=UPI0019FADC1E|nr:FadR/GntR family transcriptional regulator [Prosthecobacter sp.]MBE2285957.1 FadR family transcriptional regulator [Prosthecobacter sp.]
MAFSSIKPQRSLVEEVCQRIASEIRDEIAGGDGWLPPERDLALKLGVSRPVIREATKRLELQGLLEVRHGVGTKVVDKLHKPLNGSLALLIPDDKERLRQLMQVRFMIEPENARLAAVHATTTQIRQLKAALKKLEEADAYDAAVDADMAFHRELAIASGNQIAALLLHSLSDLMQIGLTRGYSRVSTTNAVREHAAILTAIEKRDAAAAAKAMREHLSTAELDLALPKTKKAR